MEGTSGAADRLLLRGRGREAALAFGNKTARAVSPQVGSGSLRTRMETISRKRARFGISTSVENLGLGVAALHRVAGQRRSPAFDQASRRQEVSEPIGLGQSFLREQSRRNDAVSESSRPLTRETSVGSPRKRRGTQSSRSRGFGSSSPAARCGATRSCRPWKALRRRSRSGKSSAARRFGGSLVALDFAVADQTNRGRAHGFMQVAEVVALRLASRSRVWV
jgi:hypothetical protein